MLFEKANSDSMCMHRSIMLCSRVRRYIIDFINVKGSNRVMMFHVYAGTT